MKNKETAYVGIGVLICMSILLVYANMNNEIRIFGHELIKSRDLKLEFQPKQIIKPQIISKTILVDTNSTSEKKYDTANKRILLIGDSQAGGIMYPLNNYIQASGHSFVLAMPWYSASDRTYASNDTLKNIISRFKPTYIIFVIGLNQVFQQNMEPSIVAVEKIKATFGDIPYAWIGPANWVEDKGINKVYQENLPEGTLFVSKDLILPRGGDGKHPNSQGYNIWMDSIAQWLNNTAKWKINMVKPANFSYKRAFQVKTLNAGRVSKTPSKENSESKQEEQLSDTTSTQN